MFCSTKFKIIVQQEETGKEKFTLKLYILTVHYYAYYVANLDLNQNH